MGLDIYSGKLIRYYSGDWQTRLAQLLSSNSDKFTVIDVSGNEIEQETDDESVAEVRKIITQWADSLAASIAPTLSTPLWDETTECDYYTDKPGWEGYGALVMLQACLTLKHKVPEYVEARWNVFDEPVVKKALSMDTGNSLLSAVVLWLPIDMLTIFDGPLPTGEEVSIATVALLKQELEELNRQLWNADETTILSWRDEYYYEPVTVEEPKRLFGFRRRKKEAPNPKFRTEDLAKSAYSILYRAVRFAEDHQASIMMDF